MHVHPHEKTSLLRSDVPTSTAATPAAPCMRAARTSDGIDQRRAEAEDVPLWESPGRGL